MDVITPIVDDPYTFGTICAANSVSDVYAMGGSPVSALAILGFSSCDFSHTVIKNLLNGVSDKLKEAGASLVGGHSIEDKEFKFGLSVTGWIDKKKILRANGSSAGDVLILTKPLGTGILSSAFKRGVIRNTGLKEAVRSMTTLNKTASRLAVLSGSRAATDITGFGLLGHITNMVEDSRLDFVISDEKIPVMKNVRKLAASGTVPKGAHNNLGFVSSTTVFPRGFPKEEKLVLSDPQTSGGLLISLASKNLAKFSRLAKKEKMPFWLIGEVTKGRGRIIVE